MDYGYINARVRGMHSRLLDKKGFDALMVQPDIPSLTAELEKTPYQSEIQEASVLYSGIRGIEAALRMNLVHTCQKILSIVQGSDALSFVQIFLSRWDVHNLKAIMRGKHMHTPPDEIQDCLVHAGSLGEPLLTELLKQPDVRAVVDLMATWEVIYSRPLTLHLDEYADSRNLSMLEYALDRFHYQNALECLDGRSVDHTLLRRLIAEEIDCLNLKDAFRLNRDSTDPESSSGFFLHGGRSIPLQKYQQIISAGTSEEAGQALEGTPFYFLIPLVPVAMRSRRFSMLEKEMDRYLTRNGIQIFRSNPLGGALTVGYLFAKQNEIVNIRIIARCKDANVPDAELEEEMMHV